MNLSPISFLNRIQSWFSQAEATATEETLEDLSPEIIAKLETIISQLPDPPTYSQTIQKAVLASLKNWKENQFSNRLVILGSPIADLTGLISRCFPHQQLKNLIVIYPFSDLNVREKPSQISQKLKQAIKKEVPASSQKKIIIIIPDLEQFFLRCIGGWDGMTWLREYIVNTPEYFWLLGCNSWSWKFLDYVCQTNAYLETVVKLPQLDETELAEWFQPIHEGLITKEVRDKLSFFWKTLGYLSEGNSEIATQIWLQSLKMVKAEKTPEGISDIKLIAPTLPKLPTLSASNRYVLQALLLHGSITRSSLALSLGEKEDNIQAEIQILSRQKLIKQQGKKLRINPLYYPKIKQELNQNNFLIGDE